MAAGNFDDKLVLRADGGIDTKGPLDAGADVVEMCVWVAQRKPDTDDAAATEMTTVPGRGGFRTEAAPRKWAMIATKVSFADFVLGPAFAMAIALIRGKNDAGADQVKVQLWAQSVELVAPPAP